MAPRLSLRPVASASRSLAHIASRSRPTNVCLFCSLARPNRARRNPSSSSSPPWTTARRTETTIASPTDSQAPPTDARTDLKTALQTLQKQAPNYVNLSRIQLALRNLSQPPGEESIRVAVLGMTTAAASGSESAKQLLRLVLADPLKPEQEWERQLVETDATQPVILHVGQTIREQERGAHLTFAKTRDELLPEIEVSSPGLDRHNLEVLLMETNPFDERDAEAAEEAVLVPTVDIPSNTGRYTPVSTPVHRALIVSEGILGAASLVSSPLLQEEGMVSAAVNLDNYKPPDQTSYPFHAVDIPTATKALALFREDVANAGIYEKLWFESNLPAVTAWLKSHHVLTTPDGSTKLPVKALMESILRNTSAALQAEEARILSATLTSQVAPSSTATLDAALSDWAHQAHTELQTQLDRAFTGRRWRQLGWWKLFWRVDDVGLLSAETLSARFLPEAERGIIYLAGRIREAGLAVESETEPTYAGPVLAGPDPEYGSGSSTEEPTMELRGEWPTQIAFTRGYLVGETVPALQALGQRLVLQSLGTSAAMGSLAGLVYVSGIWGAGMYEAGAVAALGVVWSLRRLQRKWEGARAYWEGEVREEGRKAVRATEASVGEVFEKARRREGEMGRGSLEEVRMVRGLVAEAEAALARLK